MSKRSLAALREERARIMGRFDDEPEKIEVAPEPLLRDAATLCQKAPGCTRPAGHRGQHAGHKLKPRKSAAPKQRQQQLQTSFSPKLIEGDGLTVLIVQAEGSERVRKALELLKELL